VEVDKIMINKTNWGVGDRIRLRFNFLTELQEESIIEIKWIGNQENCSDILSKSLPANIYKKHAKRFCFDDGDPEITLWDVMSLSKI
jgi:hypothetical protein